MRFFTQDRVSLEAKLQVYRSICRAIVCFACQVWGYCPYEVLEKFQRFFVKKLFCLPRFAPNYFIDLELGLTPLECVTLSLQIRYCLRVLALPHNRLARIVALEVINSRVSWFKHWVSLAQSCSCAFDDSVEFSSRWQGQLLSMCTSLEASRREQALARASESNRFLLYRVLVTDYVSYGIQQFVDGLSFREIRWLMKLRGELLWLNCKPWEDQDPPEGLCGLCNSVGREDLYHFLGVCPSLAEIRRLHLGCSSLERDELMEYLSGRRSCLPLVRYSAHAWKYRSDYIPLR